MNEARPLRIVQMTDLHLLGDAHARYRGLDTRQHFLDALALTRRLAPDLLILTGDLAQDEATATYAWLHAQLQQSGLEWVWLPGNHDDPDKMQAFAEPVFHRTYAHWQLLGLSSHQPGQVEGWLDEQQLQRLQQALQQPQPLLVALHHPPIKVNSRWMDAIGLQNADAFWQLVDNPSHQAPLKLLLCGHVHQPLRVRQQQTLVLTTPATAAQFTPFSDDFSINDKGLPAIRLLRLRACGQHTTRLLYYQPMDLLTEQVDRGVDNSSTIGPASERS